LKEEKIINFQQYRNEKIIHDLREYPDSYEYMMVREYEKQFHFTHTECIQMDDCFAQLVRFGRCHKMVSVVFFKDHWTVPKILEFLTEHRIEMFDPAANPIEIQNAAELIDAKLFRGHPLVLYKKGNKNFILDPNNLEEVTEMYEQYNKITHTGIAEKVMKENINVD